MSNNRWPRPPSEVVAEGLRIEAELQPIYAAKRSRDARRAVLSRYGKDRDGAAAQEPHRGPMGRRVGVELGVDMQAYRRGRAVYLAAQAEPHRYGDLVELMDRTRQVSPAYRLYQQRRDGAIQPLDEAAVERLAIRIDDLTGHLVDFDPMSFSFEFAEQTAKQIAATVSKLRRFRNQLIKERK